MKKSFLIIFVVIFAIGFALSSGLQPAAAAEKDKYGGVLKVAISKSPKAFGYPPTIRAADQDSAGHALEFLIRITLQNVVEPALATGWNVAPDGKSFTFKLRKGVKFHDGTAFNAQAVKFNLDLWKKSKGPVLKKIKSVDIVDDYTIRINLSGYDALIMYELSTEAYMVSPTALEKNGKKWAETHPVGTGSFKLKKYERDVSVEYERFDDYWQKGRPYLDGLERLVIKNSMTQIASLKTGEIHGIRMIAKNHAKMMEKEGYVLSNYDGPCIGLHGDSKNPNSVWANRKVREAIEYAIDKETMLKELGLGFPKVLYQLVTPDSPYYFPDLKPRKYDPEKAKKLLAEAGYPNGFKTTLTHLNRHWPESWPAIQADLAKVGIDMKIIPVDRPKFLKIRFEGALKNGGSHVLWGGMNNVLGALKNSFLSTARHIPDTARPAGYDAPVKKALAEKDPEARKALIHQAAKLLYDDVTFIPMYVEARLWAFDRRVKGSQLGGYTLGTGLFTNTFISKK
ncbi:MAG: ABC transporter substrate-binding protein [Deltaproteobacteria bacterium]|nr:ABC transporter substrate-binding protein [Deltaproteobacteria bacterium]